MSRDRGMSSVTMIVSPPLDNASNETLAVQAQGGCRASFALLVSRFQVPLLHFLRSRTATVQDAEDLTQEVFVRAFRSIARYEPKWQFSTWIYTIAHRLSLNARRRWRPTIESQAVEALSTAVPGVDDVAAAAEDSRRLWKLAAALLTPEQVTALWLFYVEDMSLEEMAVVLHRTAGAAKGLLFRGRRKLAKHLIQLESNSQTGPVQAANGVAAKQFAEHLLADAEDEAESEESDGFDADGVDSPGNSHVNRESLSGAPASGGQRAGGVKAGSAGKMELKLTSFLPPRLAAELYDG